MASTLIQSGSSLQMVSEAGVVTTLTLPSGITLATDRPPRFARFGHYTVLVNTPNRPISIDPLGKVRVLVPFAPSTKVTVASGGAGNLTGVYKVKQTFVIRDGNGNIIAESDFGPAMNPGFTASANTLAVSGINISADAITGSNLYRTTAGGETYFKWRELDGNTQTTAPNNDLADLSLEVFAAPTLGTPPDLSLIAEWRGRLWGASKVDLDVLRWSEPGTMYAWSALNAMSIPRIGEDARGISGLLTRRESLMVGRRNNVQQVTGTSNNDFRLVKITDHVGIESNETIAVYKDMIFFLWKDGVYVMEGNDIQCVSDAPRGLKKGGVRSWFATDTYFNRAQFQNAVAYFDPVRLRYRLFLAAAGTSVLNRWVEYDLNDGTWWGPHKTGAFTPASAFVTYDSNDSALPLIGGTSGHLWKEQSTATDDTATAIDFDVDTTFNVSDSPTLDKYHGRLYVAGKAQTTGTVAVTPTVGRTDATAGSAFQYVMSKGKQLLGRIGNGLMFKLNFRHNVAAEPVELYGYEVDDIHPLGKRG
jgi:hypothetical protein